MISSTLKIIIITLAIILGLVFGICFRLSDQMSNLIIIASSFVMFAFVVFDKSEGLKSKKKFLFITGILVFLCGLISIILTK